MTSCHNSPLTFGQLAAALHLGMALVAIAISPGCHRSASTPDKAIDAAPRPGPSEPAEQAVKEEPAEEPTAPTADPPAPAGRFLLFTPRGPLVCELTITVGGRPSNESLDNLVDEAIGAAHALSDAEPTWSNLVESRSFRYGQFGNAPIKGDDERRQAIARYDWNRNGRVERDEMRRFLTRNQRSDNSLALRSYDLSLGLGAAAAPLWQLLDADGDQVLSAEELRDAPARLRTRDDGDNEMVAMNEASPKAGTMPDRQASRLSAARFAYLLDAATDWKQVLAELAGQIENDTQRAAELFRELDTNRSESLSVEEFKALIGRAPDVRIGARFSDPIAKGEGDPPPAIELEALDGTWTVSTIRAVAGQAFLLAPGLTLDYSLNDAAGGLGSASQSAESQLERLDKDDSGELDREEARAAEQSLGAFEAIDANEDDSLDLDELRTHLARQSAASAATFQLNIRRGPDPLLAALDENRDGRLGAREIAEAGTRLALLDQNGDGQVTPGEVPERILIQIVRGQPAADPMAMTADSAPKAERQRSGPPWFQRMDVNGDGDVSTGEFLGSDARFRELDENHDGFLDAVEAERAAKKVGQQSER